MVDTLEQGDLYWVDGARVAPWSLYKAIALTIATFARLSFAPSRPTWGGQTTSEMSCSKLARVILRNGVWSTYRSFMC